MTRLIWHCPFKSVVAVVFVMLLTSCESDSPTKQLAIPTSAITLSDRVIVPGERIGPVRLAGKIEDIAKMFGSGAMRGSGPPGLFVLQTWDALGLWVEFNPGTKNVVWISVDDSGSNLWAEHSTAEGVRLGTTRQELVSIMGSPERTVTGGGATSLYYDRQGIRFSIADAGSRGGKIIGIRVVWPSVMRGDGLVVPGNRISGIILGAPVDQALTILGGGYHRGESSPGVHVFYWPHFGMTVVERAGRVVSVRAGGLIPADAAGLRYATTGGLGRGSTISEIKAAFGESGEGGASQFGGHWLLYRPLGVGFEFNKDWKVRLIDVFPPERS